MYFNQKQFINDLELKLVSQKREVEPRKVFLDRISKEVDISIFTLLRFKDGIIENEVIADYYRVCEWMKKDPLMYLFNFTTYYHTQEERKPILLMRLPSYIPMQYVSKINEHALEKDLERDYHVMIIYDPNSKQEELVIELLSVKNISESENQKIVTLTEDTRKLLEGYNED